MAGDSELNKRMLRAVDKKEGLEKCRDCLIAGADPNVCYECEFYRDHLVPIIFYAACQRDRELIQLLVDFGADINKCEDPYDESILDAVLSRSKQEAIFILKTARDFEERISFLSFLFSLGCKPRGNVLTSVIYGIRFIEMVPTWTLSSF